MLMMRVVVASLITNFEIAPKPGVDMTAYWDRYSAMLKRPLEVKLTPISRSQPSSETTVLKRHREEIALSPQSIGSNSLTRSNGIVEHANVAFLPDLFVSWASLPMKSNSNLGTAGKQADEWFEE
jgi:RNAse (barnase) inhibitor barstar